jgi:hypothetical protein
VEPIEVESEVGRGSRFEMRFTLRPCGVGVPDGGAVEKLSA